MFPKMYDVDGHLNYVRYNVNAVVGLMGCRTNGLSDQWVVEPMGCRTIGLSDHREVSKATQPRKYIHHFNFIVNKNGTSNSNSITHKERTRYMI